jgi:hypothetical protein
MQQEDGLIKERRQYIRLDSVFPVQFRLVSTDGRQFLSDWQQGFTNNVGKGGICLIVNNLAAELTGLLKKRGAKLSLGIEMPLARKPVNALAEVTWIQEASGLPGKYLVGLNYLEINSWQNNRILRYALAKKFFVPFVLIVIFTLVLGFTVNGFINIELIKKNKALVEQLVKTTQESNMAKNRIKEMVKEGKDLQERIQALQLQIQNLEKDRYSAQTQAKIEVTEKAKGIAELNDVIEQLSKEKNALEEQLVALKLKENTAAEELTRLDRKKTVLEKANFDKMYKWLKVHQNPRTGLVMSFEGDGDVADWAFIYDQSLAAQAYTHFSDVEGARRIFDFFDKKAKRDNGLFLNAYYCSDGNPAEYVVHSGPNIWLGIAIVQYTKKTRDASYVDLAREIAAGIINLQDKDGGIRGGPGQEWYSTEHNLDAYAFFNMLYKITGEASFKEAAKRVLNWLVLHTYGRPDVPIKRGKGDSTIATDTYAWSIAAIGPDKLQELGMDPDKILEFAEKNCSVEVEYSRPEGQSVRIKGFDFAAQRNTARGGVISSEWTAQMIMAFKIMADFYSKKGLASRAGDYAAKADEYLSELSNMIISSPSPSGQGESCLAYATQEYVDTGHGWLTPKGKSTGSVAGTAYTLFAYYGYNPLELKD